MDGGNAASRTREWRADSLICHAPIALTSTHQRIDGQGQPQRTANNPFAGHKIAVAGKTAEKLMLHSGYPRVPGQRTRLTYYVDEALETSGFPVAGTINPSSVKIVYNPALALVTGNGPQAVDQQAEKLRTILGG